MAVSKDAPFSVLGSRDELLDGLLGLTLTEGNGLESDVLLSSETVNHVSGVSALGQNDDDGDSWA